MRAFNSVIQMNNKPPTKTSNKTISKYIINFSKIRKELALNDNVRFNLVKYSKDMTAEEAEKQARENLMETRHYYEAGLISLSEYLEAQGVWQNACSAVTETKAALRTAYQQYLQSPLTLNNIDIEGKVGMTLYEYNGVRSSFSRKIISFGFFGQNIANCNNLNIISIFTNS